MPFVLVQIYSPFVSAPVPTLPFPFLVLGSFPLASQSQIETVHVVFSFLLVSQSQIETVHIIFPSRRRAPCGSGRSRLSRCVAALLSNLPIAISHLLLVAQSTTFIDNSFAP